MSDGSSGLLGAHSHVQLTLKNKYIFFKAFEYVVYYCNDRASIIIKYNDY